MRPLSASAIQQKNSFLADKKGQLITSNVLSIIDDPTIVRGLGSRYYDGDGIAAKIRPVISNGVLDDYFIDVYYGSYHWPAFNLADSAITVGAVMLVVDSLFMRPENHRHKGNATTDPGKER